MAKKILLADDSVTIQKVVSITLAHEDFDLVIVDNGTKALAKAKEIRPDVILLDVVMPDKDGYQVCQEIKGTADLKNTPVILLTGTFEPFDADRAAEVGADDFIKKPFESHTLINKVREMASKKGVAREKPMDISEVDIGFETPIEAGYAEKGGAGTPRKGAPVIGADLETSWEEEVTEPKKPEPKAEDTEDIWSVEEFEDIAGTKPSVKPAAKPAPAPDVWEEDRRPAQKGPKEKVGKESGASEEFFAGETAHETESEGFELGEEISEDELEKFLEEEEETEPAVREEIAEADRPLSEEADETLFASEEAPAPRAKTKAADRREEEFLVEDFEESPRENFEEIGEEDEEIFIEDEAIDKPVDLEWDEGPAPERAKAPAAEKADSDFDKLIRRTSEEELADLGEPSADFGDFDDRPKARESEVAAGSFKGSVERDGGRGEFLDSEDFTFEEAQETGGGRAEAVFDSAPKEEGALSLNQKDLSSAVDKIAREVIEKVVWEVVPELAEELIKQEIKRLKGEKA